MSFFDTIYIVAAFAMIIVLGLIMSFVMPKFLEPMAADLPPGANATITAQTDRVVGFLNLSFIALFFIFAGATIGLTIFLASHPVGLALWLIFNITTLVVWDSLSEFITGIAATDLNTGDMDTAISFFQGDMPKAIVVINVLIGAVMFGKRGVG